MSRHDLFQLKGRLALVTGGSRGIGRAIALALAEQGADIAINYRSGTADAQSTQEEIEALGRACSLWSADLAGERAVDELIDAIEAEGRTVDILVCNASLQIRKAWNEVDAADFAVQMNVNLRASLRLIQRCYPAMQQRGWGRILTLGSVQQVRPHPEMIVYSASKAAQMNMVLSLAPQFAPHGVTINNLAPGAILTRRNEAVLDDEAYRQKVAAAIPVNYIGEDRDCAGAALLLCSDAGRYITGQDYLVDGGMSLHY